MTRLFIALDFPGKIRESLASIRPAAFPGLREIPIDQFHLTLHFLGETDLNQITRLLKKIKAPAFSLRLGLKGTFESRDGGTIFWIGFEPSPPLIALHGQIGKALTDDGLSLENRPYQPHLTLARANPRYPKLAIQDFCKSATTLPSEPIPITGFHLYSSLLKAEGPTYTREASFELSEKT